MRENRKLRLEIILGLLQELKSPKDSVKRQIHETYFNDIKFRTLCGDFEKLIELGIIAKFKTKEKWTTKEDNLLIKYSKKMILDDVRKRYLPHRTIFMLRHRSRELKLDLHQYSTTIWNKHWTDEELKILIRCGELKLSLPEIKIHLIDRTNMSISLKLWKLGYSTKQHKKEDYQNRPWDKEEIRILRKWYPLVGTGESEMKNIIDTPNIKDFIPNRSVHSLQIKSHKLGIEYNPQKGLKFSERRCLLCLEVKSMVEDFSGIKRKESYCKDCKKTIGSLKKYVRKDYENYEILGSSLQRRYLQEFGQYIPRSKCIINIKKVIDKHGYKCFFSDEFCSNRHLKNLTIEHINPISKSNMMYDMINPDNILIMCLNHNILKSDLDMNDFKLTIKNMSKKIDKFYKN